MFERYTEKARRVIFYARYEASQFGTPEIETEHLLLALLRESGHAITQYLRTPIGIGGLRAQILQRFGQGEPFPTSADIPLTNASKRVLAYAAEEADRFGHRHIGAEHLFLGLLREEKSLAAQVLREHGASLKEVRREIEKAGPWPGQSMAARFSVGDPGVGSGGPSHVPNLQLIAEDGSPVEDVFWNGRFFRIPAPGEAIEVEHDGSKKIYRVLDVVWHVLKTGDAAVSTGHVVLKVRAEGPTNSSPPSAEI